jgi:hypothetical protein
MDVLGALGWVAVGVLIGGFIGFVAGRQTANNLSSDTFSAMIESGILLVKTDDGWIGEQPAFDELVRRYLLKNDHPTDHTATDSVTAKVTNLVVDKYVPLTGWDRIADKPADNNADNMTDNCKDESEQVGR